MGVGRPVPDLAAAVAAHGLPTEHRLPGRPLDGATWAALLSAAGRERIAGHLVKAVTDGALAATGAQRRDAEELHAIAVAGCLVLERALLDTVELLEGSGIDHRAMKGPTLARRAYPDPSLRSFGDVDILVPAAAFDDAIALLCANGYRRPVPELRPGFDRRFGKAVTLVTPDGLEIDVHRTIVDGRFGLLVPLDELFGSPVLVAVGRRDVRALPLEHEFLAVCFNAAIGSRELRLAPLRDVAQMATTTELEIPAVLRSGRRWGAEAVVALGVGRAWDVLAVRSEGPLPAWASSFRPARADARALRRHTSARATWLRMALSGLPAVRGPSQKLAYLRAVLVPRQPAVSRRRLHHVVRAARRVRPDDAG